MNWHGFAKTISSLSTFVLNGRGYNLLWQESDERKPLPSHGGFQPVSPNIINLTLLQALGQALPFREAFQTPQVPVASRPAPAHSSWPSVRCLCICLSPRSSVSL